MRVIVFYMVLLSGFGMEVEAQKITPQQLGFEPYELVTNELGTVNYYLTPDTGAFRKPLLVYLDGSGPFPLFQEVPQGIGSTVVFDFQRLRQEFRILLISKPGVPFIDKVESDEYGYP
ncbi:MAG: hypothetical protein AAF840_15590, partial [Bacteroidota bacterium]